jgi:isopenicillin-N epimerase
VNSFWQRQRKHVLMTPGTINFNAGTMSPTPIRVMAAADRLRRMQAANPSDFLWRQTPVLLAPSRARLAKYLNCKTQNLLLLPNVTWGMNLAATSLDLPAGSEILTTDHEYGAMVMAWQRLAKARRWKVRHVEIPYKTENPADIVEAIAAGFTRRTRVLFFSHVTSTTGLVLPARRLCAVARRHGAISVIDGAHAPGMVPVDVSRIDADFYGANCHKWMMAPACAGFLHVKHALRPLVQPAITSWGWGYDPKKLDEPINVGTTRWQNSLEFHGCADRTPQMVLGETLDFRKSLGGDEAVFARCRELSNYAREKLSACGMIPVTPANPALSGALMAFEFPSAKQVLPDQWLWNTHRIECPVTRAAGRAFLRVSTAWFNTHAEIERLAEVLRKQLGKV